MTYLVVRDLRRDALEKSRPFTAQLFRYSSSRRNRESYHRDVDQFGDGLLMDPQLFTGVMTILGTLVFMLLSVNMTLTG